MHAAKLRRRGYNQAELLARGFAQEAGLPLFEGLSKLHKTESQTRKGRAARVENQRGAFGVAAKLNVNNALEGRHILLIDDVVTTGATIEQAAIPLVEAGARLVSVAAIANA
jgi:predicted amidophosphoribosyltransferase